MDYEHPYIKGKKLMVQPMVLEPLNGVYIDLKKRGIPKEYCEKWKCQYLSNYLGQPAVAHEYQKHGQLNGYVIRLEPKDFILKGSVKECDMYGSWLHGDPVGKTLVITEGHFDCIINDMIVGAAGYNHTTLNYGSGSVKDLLSVHYDTLSRYQFITLCFDWGEGEQLLAGNKARDTFIKEFNQIGKVKVAKLPLKDANEMHLTDRGNELKWAIIKAETYKPKNIINLDDILDKILEKPKVGIPWPWQAMTDIDHGYYQGKSYLIGSATDVGKCLAPNTPVIMYDGGVKLAKDIRLNDQLMGPDSNPRLVKSITSGQDDMYKIIPKRGDSYVVNSKHILSLHCCWTTKRFNKGTIYDIPLYEYLTLSNEDKRSLKSIRAVINFSAKHQSIDPYIYGLWLGDGTKVEWTLTNKDQPILDIWCKYIEDRGGFANLRGAANRCSSISGVFNKKSSPFRDFIHKSVINGEKRILPEYLLGDIDQRLNLLAGLIDSDGHLTGHKKIYEISTKYKGLNDDILYLCRSLGFITTSRVKITKNRPYYRIFISGKIYKVPVVLERKIAVGTFRHNNPYVSRIDIEYVGKGDYNGFTLDSDGRFLLGDFQITHNSTFIKDIVFHLSAMGIKGGMFFLEHRPEELAHKLLSARVGHDLEQPDTTWWDTDRLREEIEDLKKTIFLFDPTQGIELQEIINSIYYFVNLTGVSYVVIDNLTILSENRMVDGKRVSEMEFLNEVGKQFNKLKRELNVSFFIICHLSQDKISKQAYVSTSPKNEEKYLSTTSEGIDTLVNRPGLTWESGRTPCIENLYGGATSAKLAHEVWVLARDTTSSDDFTRRTTRVKCLKGKNKKRGCNLEFKLIWSNEEGRLLELKQ